MVVEKPLLAAFPAEAREAGCPTEADGRRFAAALARKHARFAFPDDFNAGMKRVANQIVSRHGKDSDMGGFLEAVQEIRALLSGLERRTARGDLAIRFRGTIADPDRCSRPYQEVA